MLDSETARALIKPEMAIVCSNGKPFATVAGVGSTAIEVTHDTAGRHYIPLTWVTSVDNRVHIDRSRDQAMHDWLGMSPVTP